MAHEAFYTTVATTIPVLMLALVLEVRLSPRRKHELRWYRTTGILLGFIGEVYVMCALFGGSDSDAARGVGFIGMLALFAMVSGALARSATWPEGNRDRD